MKVFVAMSDASLRDRSELYQQLVPFNPSFLKDGAREGRKPFNWVAECNYDQARERLAASKARQADVPADIS